MGAALCMRLTLTFTSCLYFPLQSSFTREIKVSTKKVAKLFFFFSICSENTGTELRHPEVELHLMSLRKSPKTTQVE